MADLGSASWSEIDASNDAIPPNGWPEGMAPSDVNNSARSQMGGEKRWWDRSNSTQTTTGTSTAYVLTYAATQAALYDGEETSFIVHATCGDNPTLVKDGFPAHPIRKFVGGAFTACLSGDLLTSQPLRVRYNLADTAYDIVSANGTAANLNVGTDPGDVVQIDANGALPGGLGWKTGNLRPTFQTTSDAGWLMLDDTTIGDSSSGATHTGTDYQALYTVLWNGVSSPSSNVWCAVTGGLGANAAADWAAHKAMALPKALGRVMGVAGAGSGLTSRALGSTVGEETHTLTKAEIPPPDSVSIVNTSGAGNAIQATTSTAPSTAVWSTLSGYGGGAHNNMQPSFFPNVEIKL